MNKRALFFWILLIIFNAFDNIFSYFAIVYHGMREWNAVARFFVNLNPKYYFLSIILTPLFLYCMMKLVGWISWKSEKSNKKAMREFSEKIFLGCIVIAWGIGVTLFNFITFVRGFSSIHFIRYEVFLGAGILCSMIYLFYNYHKFKSQRLSL